MGFSFGFGLRMVRDNMQRFMRASGPVYLRVRNFDETAPALDLGFSWAASGQATGYTDTQIDPPPQVTNVSTHDIGISGGKLMFGARRFDISDTWVRGQMVDGGYANGYQVFRNSRVIGLFYDGRLFSIEDAQSNTISGENIFWKVLANTAEKDVTT